MFATGRCVEAHRTATRHSTPPLSPAPPRVQVNKDPYASGWIIKIKLSNKDDLKNLLDAQAYAKEIEH